MFFNEESNLSFMFLIIARIKVIKSKGYDQYIPHKLNIHFRCPYQILLKKGIENSRLRMRFEHFFSVAIGIAVSMQA